ncbi:MAG: LysM peptidoglycan-binding domain-containing protein [Candidatus Tokpelaia sp.]|nr:MAG: LysM peptidoglycan-binding domain-containing protein [Candidatus Tokpelaia sp.]KAA6206871.1 MAG: LysM peptidoglycan-binding domain-containing protein [Candidatus Tokpelaia sp.]
MSLVHFVKITGKDLSGKGQPPTAALLKRDLDSYNLGTERVRLQIEGDTVILRGTISNRGAFEKMVVAVGNILGIAAVESKAVKINEAGSDTGITYKGRLVYYIVKYGDNLSHIAEKLYGHGFGVKGGLIFEANRPMLRMPSKIFPGQLLRIPALPLQK